MPNPTPKLQLIRGIPVEVEKQVDHEVSTQYFAYISGEPSCWGRGVSGSEAIGDLIRSNLERFGIRILSWPGN